MTTYAGTWRSVLAPNQYNVKWQWPIDPALQVNSWPLCATGATDDTSALIRGGAFNTPTVPGLAQPRPITYLSPIASGDQAQIQRALNKGDDVFLTSGVFNIASTIVMPSFSRIFSSGATVKCLPGGSAALVMFQPGSHSTFEGLNLWPTSRAILNTITVNFAMKSCTLYGGMLGQVGAGGLFQYNNFVACSVQVYARHLHWKSSFSGIAASGPSCFSTGASNSAIVDCIWDRTDRGPVFQVGHSSVNNCALVRPFVRDICQVPGGSEWFLAEGSKDDAGDFSNNLIWGMRVRGCVASMMFSGCTAKNNLIHDIDADQAGTVLFKADGPAGVVQSGNTIEFAELHGGTVGWLANANNNILRQSALIDCAVGRGGMFDWTSAQAPIRYGPLTALTGNSTNKAISVRVVGLDTSDALAWPGGVDCTNDTFRV